MIGLDEAPWSEGDFAGLSECCDLECKAAQGRDGRGELPDDFWKSYSAMANTDGGKRRSAATVFDLADQASSATSADVVPPELAAIPSELVAVSLELGVSGQGRVAPAVLRETILALCTNRLLGLRVLAQALRRDPDDLRKLTLTPMVKEGALRTAYPSMTDPRQAYTASTNSAENKE
jgi:hypothetical protein